MKNIIIHSAAAAILTLISSCFGYAEIGCALSIGFYYGREVAQYQTRLIYKYKTHTHAQSLKEGWLLWEWTMLKRLEFLAPAVGSILAVLFVQ